MKILIIRFSSIGDIVLTTPVIRCLKQQLPNVEIHYATKKQFASIVRSNPYISKVLELSDYEEEIIEQAKLEKYDWIIDLHKNIRTLKIKSALKKITKSKSFDKLNFKKWLLTNFKINNMPNVHIVDRYLDTVAHLGVHNDGQGLDYFIPEVDKLKDSDIPTSHLAGYIGIVIGAAHATKQYPLEKLHTLCSQLNYPIILLGGKEDAEKGAALTNIDPFRIYNACGKFNLNESADLVRRAKAIVSNDTGLMHIAAAFKKPIISIWGNTVPAFGMTPYYGSYNINNFIMENKNVGCRPCSKIGYDCCPKKHFNCMNNIDDKQLLQIVNQFLGR